MADRIVFTDAVRLKTLNGLETETPAGWRVRNEAGSDKFFLAAHGSLENQKRLCDLAGVPFPEGGLPKEPEM